MPSLYEKLSHLQPTRLAPKSKFITHRRQSLGFCPFITISREPGSGGRPISKLLEKRTGFKQYNRELIEKVAKSSKLRHKLLSQIDEKGRTTLQDWVHSVFNPDYVSDVKYIKYLSNVILNLSEQGNVILLGRGSNFITSKEHGLHIRICAPYLVRVDRAIKYEKIPARKAKDVIKSVDADRKHFISQYFGKNISSANYYDLILNTEFMSLKAAVDLILIAFEHKFPGYLRRYRLRRKQNSV